MAKPFIRKAGFWADGINGLLLRPPYRTYTKTPAAPVEQNEAPSTSSEGEDEQLLSPEEGVRGEIAKSILGRDPGPDGIGQTLVGSHASEAHTIPVKSVSVRGAIAGTNPPAGFPTKLWEHSLDVATVEEFTQTLDALPAYITEALQPDTLFSSERLRKYGFEDKEPEMLRSVVTGMERGDIAAMTGTNPEHVRRVLNRAYDMFGVSNPQGLHSAICWLATKEAEGIARSVRQKFEKDILAADRAGDDYVGSSTDQQENRP